MRPVAVDTETMCPHGTRRGGVDWRPGGAEVILLAWDDGETSEAFDPRRNPNLVRTLADRWLGEGRVIIGHNLKFDLHLLCRQFGWPVPSSSQSLQYADTMLRASLIAGRREDFSLDAQYRMHCDPDSGKDETIYHHLAQKFGGSPTAKAQAWRLSKADREVLESYAKRDVAMTRRLYERQEEAMQELGLRAIHKLEQHAFAALFDMEHRGVPVDPARIEEALAYFDPLIARMESELTFIPDEGEQRGLGGLPKPRERLNVDSSKQLAEAFGYAAGRTRNGSEVPLTEKGAPCFDSAALKAMTDERDRELAGRILHIRKIKKLANTFLKKHLRENVRGDRLYPKINQMAGNEGGTYTGRLSYTDPALQQIPHRDREIAEPVRRCFRPPKGFKWTTGDFSQLELRMLAAVASTPELRQAYKDDPDVDMHTYVAERMGIPRSNKEAAAQGVNFDAKTMNFAMVFGAGPGLVAEKQGLPFTWEIGRDGLRYRKAGQEAYDLLDKYDEAMPGVRSAQEIIRERAKNSGFYRTNFGRRVAVPSDSAYSSAGNLYQSLGADCNKIALVILHRLLEDKRSEMVLNIHDEFSVLIAEGEEHLVEDMGRAIEKAINGTERLEVPVRIDFCKPVDDWWETSLL